MQKKQPPKKPLSKIESLEYLGVYQKNWRKITFGPLIFIILTLLPVIFQINYFNWQQMGALGMLFWMTWWWIEGSIAVAITALLPIALTALIPIAPATEIVKVYSNPIVFLIIASCIIGSCWQRWGLGKRLALNILSLVGSNIRKQIWAWLIMSALISSIIADTITAAIFVPVAASLLVFCGFKTNTDVWKSTAATNILLAVAWGASIGSLPTPIGGGQNLVIYNFLTELQGRDILFHKWTINMLPFSIILLPVVGLYLTRIIQKEDTVLPGSKKFYKKELDNMGSMSRGEIYSGLAFLIAVSGAFLKPLIVKVLPWFEFPFLFFVVAFILFFIPAEKGENVLSFKVFKYFPINVVILWPSALALAKVLELSGLADKVINLLSQYAGNTSLIMFLIFIGATTIITNMATNTASAALVIPIIISMFIDKGLNPIPMILSLIVAVNLAFAIPSGNGCLAVSSGFGINLRTMFKHGLILSIICWIITSVVAYLLYNFVPWWGII